jgi:anthranilate/para-aminobenzoate synthase component I
MGELSMSDIPSVSVRTAVSPSPVVDPLAAYLALASRFGDDQVYLLESAEGVGAPRDCRYQFVGFGELLTVSVTRDVVRATGVPALCAAARAALAPLLTPAPDAGEDVLGTLPGPRDLWPVLRAVHGLLDGTGAEDRFRLGFLAYFGYDVVRYIEDLPYLIEQEPDLPDLQLTLHQGCVVTDLALRTAELVLHSSPLWPALEPESITALLAAAEPPRPPGPVPAPVRVGDDTTGFQFESNVEKCLKHIAVGDIYQVQIGHEITVESQADPVAVYQRLRERNASPYTYLTRLAGTTVVGASPELFVRVENGEVVMRPIAGTARRGDDPAAVAARLSSDPKEIAEHIMLVDLCRNDIGRICARDTLEVVDQLTVEQYSHVLHLVSTVVGRLAPDKDAFDVVAALFPAGTMTGAPKVRAMEIIETIERSRRGLYAGALGLLDVGGYVNLALCIRTLFHRDGVYRTRASAGVVADSEPRREWRETLAKSSAAYWAVNGEELMTREDAD